MQEVDIADQHNDIDTDSLFGSPPPSPGRGRSPSSTSLALPSGEDTAQNVGTLALPGSHLCSEFPPVLPPAPPVVVTSRPRPQPLAQARQLPPERSSTVPPSAQPCETRAAPVPRKKRPSRFTPADERHTTPPIQLPSPDEPVPPNFLRNQEALLGRAGLVAGVRPADLALQRHTRGATPSNPIVVEDEDEQPRIGRRPIQSSISPRTSNLPTPSYEEIIHSLVKQKNLAPVLDALLRIVTGSARVPSATGPAYGSTYPYQPYYPFTLSSGFHTQHQGTSSRISRAPKRRRLSSVPAGASDWDVPFPFAEGQGPPDYHTNWERERGKQLLEDLVGLVKSAVRKAAAKKAAGEAKVEEETPTLDHPVGSVEYYRERVLSHYRSPPSHAYGQSPYALWSQVYNAPPAASRTSRKTKSARPRAATTSTSTPVNTLTPTSPELLVATARIQPSARTVPPPTQSVTPTTQRQDVTPTTTPAWAKQKLPEDRCQSEPLPFSVSDNPFMTPHDQQDTPSNLDDFLSYINSLPSGDLDALFSVDLSSLPDASTTGDVNITSSSTPSTSDLGSLFDLDANMLGIDSSSLNIPGVQGLLELSMLTPSAPFGGLQGHATNPLDQTIRTVSNTQAAPPTPTLVGSPLSQSDMGPPTPNWDFAFPEPEIVGSMSCARPADGTEVSSTRRSREAIEGTDPGGGESDADPYEKKDKGKGKAVEAKGAMGARDASQFGWSTDPRTATASIATSHESTPAPVPSVLPLHLLPSAQPATVATVPSSSTLYSHHLTSLLNVPAYGIAGSRFDKPGARSRVDRESLLNRARAMRAQLVAELERAKVELWETTMEGGCLVTLGKEADKIGGGQRSSSVDLV